MVLQVSHKAIGLPLELHFKIPLPILNIQLILIFVLAVAFKKSFISHFGPDIKNQQNLVLVTSKDKVLIKQSCSKLQGKHKTKTASAVHQPLILFQVWSSQKDVAMTHVTFQFYFQVQVMITCAIQLSPMMDLWGPPLALNRELGSALTGILLQPCVPALRLVIRAFQ